MANISHFTQTVGGVSTTYDIHDANAVPKTGSNQISGDLIPSSNATVNLGSENNNYSFAYITRVTYPLTNSCSMGGGYLRGGEISAFGALYSSKDFAGAVRFLPQLTTNFVTMMLYPSGTWTWSGTACQITSDQRLKQQIAKIDDKLLDAWEDVNLVQFKYNDAVDQKKDKARLHTGYVVQQIDSACKSHNVDISQYGLYCHEEYPEETEEVEAENEDGTKVKERKVIREASEHYSLRYTEVYAVECMYLRRCIKQLTARIEQLTTRIEQLEKGNGTEASK